MLYKKLKQMQERPGMFPCETVSEVLTFVEGYGNALNEHNIKDEDYIHFLNFNEFVKNFYNIQSTHANWAMMIRYNSGTGQNSLKQFFEILNKYVDQ